MKYFLATFIALSISTTQAQLLNKFVPISVNQMSNDIAPGYILLTPSALSSGQYPTNVSILDSVGNPIYVIVFDQGQSSGPYPQVHATDLKVNANSTLSFTIEENGLLKYIVLDSTFNPIDSFDCTGYDLDAHDFILAPNGHAFVLCYQETAADLSNITSASGQSGSANGTILGTVIQEIDTNGVVINEWKSIDHYSIDDTYDYYFVNPAYLDHAHINSLHIDTDSNYIMSMRSLNEVCKVDRLTGQFIWRLGGKNNQFTLVGDTIPFVAQHDARSWPNGDISLYDNSSFGNSQHARGIRYQLDTNNWTATVVWKKYMVPQGNSGFIGSTRFYANGNALIDWGGVMPIGSHITAQEFDVSGNLVMNIDLPADYLSYRVIKSDINFQIPRPEIICDPVTGTLSASGFTEYYWSTGETGPTINISNLGYYQVWVKYGMGYLSSERLYISSIADPCGTNGISEINMDMVRLYPVPVNSYMDYEIMDKKLIGNQLDVYDCTGRLVLRENIYQESGKIDFSYLNSGVYLIVINELTYKVIKQ